MNELKQAMDKVIAEVYSKSSFREPKSTNAAQAILDMPEIKQALQNNPASFSCSRASDRPAQAQTASMSSHAGQMDASGGGATYTHEQVMALVRYGEALVRRWDSPYWKETGHTADYIHALRQALAPFTEKESL